jgi:hypothetical protein
MSLIGGLLSMPTAYILFRVGGECSVHGQQLYNIEAMEALHKTRALQGSRGQCGRRVSVTCAAATDTIQVDERVSPLRSHLHARLAGASLPR